MKKILIALVVILLVLAGVVAYAVMNAGALVTRFKPDIEKAASQSLGTPVTLGKIDVAVFPDTKLIVDEFSVGPKKERFTLKNLTFHANLFSLAQGKIDIREISLDSPDLTFVQDKSGTRIAGLPTAPKTKEKKPTKAQQTSETAEPTKVTLPDGLSMALDAFSIKDATVRVQNGEGQPLITLSKLNLQSTVALENNLIKLPTFTFSTSLNGKEQISATGENITFELSSSDINIPQLKAQAFGGNFNSAVSLTGKQKLKTEGALQDVSFQRVIEGFVPGKPSPITGSLKSFTYNLGGSLKGQPAKNISGELSVDVKDGELKGANIAASVLKAIASLPFVGEEILGESGKEALQGDTTPVKSMTSSFQLAGGVLSTQDFLMESALFDMTGKGTISTDAAIDLKTALLFSPEFSAKLASKTKELSSILNDEERLEVPVVLQGKAADITVIPDVKRLAEMGATRALEEGASKLLDKALGNEEGSSNVNIKGLGKAFGF